MQSNIWTLILLPQHQSLCKPQQLQHMPTPNCLSYAFFKGLAPFGQHWPTVIQCSRRHTPGLLSPVFSNTFETFLCIRSRRVLRRLLYTFIHRSTVVDLRKGSQAHSCFHLAPPKPDFSSAPLFVFGPAITTHPGVVSALQPHPTTLVYPERLMGGAVKRFFAVTFSLGHPITTITANKRGHKPMEIVMGLIKKNRFVLK